MRSDDTPDAEQRRRDRVVIAAAVAAVFGPSAAIRAVRTVPGHGHGAWMREGRLAVQESHRVTAPLVRLMAERETGEI